MHSYRITTNGLYRTYRSNLNKNNQKLGNSMTTVETSRNFNTYAEDPAAASKAWRLRRSYWRTNDQIDNSNYAVSKFESAYSAMASIIDGDAGNGDFGLGLDGLVSTIRGITGSAGASRVALGKELLQTADNMVSMLNTKYGDEFVFAGADGLNVPFEWNEDKTKLLYRGCELTTERPKELSEFGITEDDLNGLSGYDLLLKEPEAPKKPILVEAQELLSSGGTTDNEAIQEAMNRLTPPTEPTPPADPGTLEPGEYETFLHDYKTAMNKYYYPYQSQADQETLTGNALKNYEFAQAAAQYAVDKADYEEARAAYESSVVEYGTQNKQYTEELAQYNEEKAAYDARYAEVGARLEALRTPPTDNGNTVEYAEKMRVYQGVQSFIGYAAEYAENNGFPYEEGAEKYAMLQSMADETTYIDVGLGMKERDDKLIPGSAFNSAVSGLRFLGFGKDENLVMVVKELGEIFSAADPENGAYASAEDEARAGELLDRLQEGVRYAQDQHTQLSADAKYLKTNLEQLKLNKSELDSQIVDTEDMDMAEAITNMNWAQYCYNAALRIGTNLLSQSLIDYMN